MTFFYHLSIRLQQIPYELGERFTSTELIPALMLFLAFVIVAISRVLDPSIFRVVLVANRKVNRLSTYLKESFPLNKLSSFLLLFNYVLSGSVIVYLFTIDLGWNAQKQWTVSLLAPLLVLVWQLGGMVLTSWLVGNIQIFRAPLAIKIIGNQLLGVLFFACALIWMLNTAFTPICKTLILSILAAAFAFRIMKSIYLVFKEGVSWFYIILYLCTLEILPLSVVYHILLHGNFV